MTISKKRLYSELFFSCGRSVSYLLRLDAPISDGQIARIFEVAFINLPDVVVVPTPRCIDQSIFCISLFYRKSRRQVPGCLCCFSGRPLNKPESCL